MRYARSALVASSLASSTTSSATGHPWTASPTKSRTLRTSSGYPPNMRIFGMVATALLMRPPPVQLPEQVRQAVRGRSSSARSAVPPLFATERRSVRNFQPRPRHDGHEFFPACRHPALPSTLPDSERQPRRKGLPLDRNARERGAERPELSVRVNFGTGFRSAGQSVRRAHAPAAHMSAAPASEVHAPGRGQACCTACLPARSPQR